jgi:hypothetical protein
MEVFVFPVAFWIFYGALPSLLMALIMRRGLLLAIFGAVVVNSLGEQASRRRAFWRALIAWSPFLLGLVLAILLTPVTGIGTAAIIVLALIVALNILSLLRPDRSLQDRLAGTWLVPK